MTRKHTPGPWTTDEREHNDPYQHVRILGGSRAIAELWIDDAPVPEYNAEQYANARLIAAAPELLEALQILLDCVTDIREINMEDYCPNSLLLARAAIAKATGGEL